jgi:transposase
VRLIPPNRDNASLEELRKAERKAGKRMPYRRLMTIRLLLSGWQREDVMEATDADASSVRRWVSRFNRFGIEGLLHEEERPGRPTQIPPERHEELKELMRHPHQFGQDFWTARKLHGYLTQNWRVELGYSTLCQNLHTLGFAIKSPRPCPPKDLLDETQRQAFREQLQQLMNDSNCTLWFADETGIEGDPRPRRRWGERGVPLTVPYIGKHLRENVIGAVEPSTGRLVCHMVPFVDREWFQLFVDDLAKATQEAHAAGRRVVLVLDNAQWHKWRWMKWHHIQPLYLPPYSPDLNPIESLWLVLKARWFTNHICRSGQELVDRIDQALRSFLTDNDDVRSICGR